MSTDDTKVQIIPFVSRTVSVLHTTALEWSTRTSDIAGGAINATSIVGSDIAINTKTLVILNTSASDQLAVRCKETEFSVAGGVFPSLSGALPKDYTIVPANGALTITIGPNGDRIIKPFVYVQSLGSGAVTASFICVQTSGSLTLG